MAGARPLSLSIIKMLSRIAIVISLLLGLSVAHANLTLSDSETFTLTNAETLTINGDLTIETSAKLEGDVSGAASIRVSGNWNNSGTFNHNNDAVYLTGNGQSTIAGTNTFYTLISDYAESDTEPGKALTVAVNTTQSITHSLTLKGSSGNLMPLASSSPGSTATLDVTGATVSVAYLDITDSVLSGYSDKPGDTNSNNNGGNTVF